MSYTKGKWKVNVWTTGRREVIAQNGLVICEVHQVHDKEEHKANAKLIASAPKLLEACKAVLVWWEEHQYDTFSDEEDEVNVYDDMPEFVKLAQQAILSAEGEG